jgi:hypothetical protein
MMRSNFLLLAVVAMLLFAPGVWGQDRQEKVSPLTATELARVFRERNEASSRCRGPLGHRQPLEDPGRSYTLPDAGLLRTLLGRDAYGKS